MKNLKYGHLNHVSSQRQKSTDAEQDTTHAMPRGAFCYRRQSALLMD